MQRGLLSYESNQVKNIGDELQSLAALQFISKVDAYMDRDLISDFRAGGKTKVLLNGWFANKVGGIFHWPPSQDIVPLFVSFHADSEFQKFCKSSVESQEYFKKHSPIGCRDHSTLNFFQSLGIEAYFSGCLTLTFPEYEGERKGVYVVDPFVRFSKNMSNEQLLDALPDAIAEKAVFLSHTHQLTSNDERFAYAHELLETYKKAELVITSRIHAALPCVAFGTPVIFIYEEVTWIDRFKNVVKKILKRGKSKTLDPRVESYLTFFNSYGHGEVAKGILKERQMPASNPGKNDTDKLAETLRSLCADFMHI